MNGLVSFSKLRGVAALTAKIWLMLFVAALHIGPSFAAPTDCAEHGGQMECTGPQVTSERYGLCSETGTYQWISNIENACGWGAVSGDADIRQKAACFSSSYTGCPGAQTNPAVWSQPGERYDSWLCWTMETVQHNGIDTNNFARITGTATYRDGAGQCTKPGGYIGIVARRDRVLGCQDGWTRYDIPGGYQCRRPLAQVLQISLTGLSETRPAGTGGISTIALTAKVTSGGQAKAGVAVTVSVDVTPHSGGHEHHDVNRPKGGLSATQGMTDANGEIKMIFISPDVAGIHTVKASCLECSNSPATKDIQVKVPDLMPISPNSPKNGDGSYVYALTSVDNIHAGSGRYHKNQYWLTINALNNLHELIRLFAKQG